MLRLFPLFAFLLLLSGCDMPEDRPLTLAERVAGTWDLAEVRDGNRPITDDFEQTVGTVVFRFESVGCCAESAEYRLTVTRPDGEEREVEQRYLVNDNPDTPNYFVFYTGPSRESILLEYELGRSYRELTFDFGGVAPSLLEAFQAMEMGYPFQESVTFRLRRR